MKYNFTQIIDRSGKDAIAIDAIGFNGPGSIAPGAPRPGFSKLPMWVADMNFATVPTIQQAMIDRVNHPCFGYYSPSKAYFDAIIDWQRDRNGVEGLTKKDIGYENGVLGCVASVVQTLTVPGEKVLMHSPTYIGFSRTLMGTGRVAELSPLKRDDQGIWRMDYEDMAERLKKNHIHLAIFCSPHNPCGRVWEQWEIEKAMAVYQANDCFVISDEIWSDLTLHEHKHIPTQSVSEDAKQRTVAIYAPSKTFNLAGLIGSYHIIYNDYLRDRVRSFSSMGHYNDMNVLSMHALIGAYSAEGRVWVDELRQVLAQNIDYACDFMESHFEGISFARPQGTYMLYLHCEDFCKAHSMTIDELLKAGWDVGVAWQDGRPFHDPWSIRMNFALPYSQVVEAMDRLRTYVFDSDS